MNGPGRAQDCGTVEGTSPGPAWWLVDGGDLVVTGPYDSHAEALWATGPLGGATTAEPMTTAATTAEAVPVYGLRRGTGRVARRPSPEDRAWLADLSEQLERVGEEWDPLVDDDSPLVGLLCQLGAALVEVGLPLHDCSGRTATRARGGVCLTPSTGPAGIVVAWSQHQRTARDAPRAPEVERWLQATLNQTLAGVLSGLGFLTTPFGGASAPLVTGRRPADAEEGPDASLR